MRWLFLFVLLLNIAYVAWELSQPGDEPVRIAQKPGAVSEILLLSERQSQQEDIEAREAGQPLENHQSALEGAATGSDQAAPESGPEIMSDTRPETRPETRPDQIGQGAVTATPPVAGMEPAAETCYTLGPFRKLENLRLFTRAIKDYVANASFRSREEREQSMFWVYLPPRTSLSKAKILGKRLEKLDIRDYYIVNNGEQKNAISLGHFREKDRAYNHADRIKALGFSPAVEPVFRSYTIYWLDYTVIPGRVIPDSVYEQPMGGNLNRLDRSCS